jgi:hypothetical protein
MLSAEKISLNRLKYFELLSKLNIDLVELSKYLDQVDYLINPLQLNILKLMQGVFVSML